MTVDPSVIFHIIICYLSILSFIYSYDCGPICYRDYAPAKQKVSSSSYPQVDGTGVSEPAPPDCSTAFSPRLWEPWTQITPPLSETPTTPPPPPPHPHLTTSQEKLLNFYLCAIQVSGPAQATCSNTLSSACTRHFHTPLCVHNPTKDWLKYMTVMYVCLLAHAPQITLHCSPASCLNVSLFAHVQYLKSSAQLYSLYFILFFSLCIGNHFYI